MTFNNPYFFLFFLPLAILGFELFGRLGRRPAIGFLAVMSLIFYAQWRIQDVAVLVTSVLMNFAFSLLIERTACRPILQRLSLAASIIANLGILCYFKYLFPLLQFLDAHHAIHHQDFKTVVLPLGISFFTFTQIAYLIDLKQGAAQREGFVSYTLFVTFFPHLIAGPIIHQKEMMPQFREARRYQLKSDDVALGLTWFAMGMFKKVMVADRISAVADSFFAQPHHQGALPTWLGVITYSMQLYFDFSGYSDMAIGMARMFSIRFPLNFDSPYKSSNIMDYWQRWHMTLTRYIMEYLYSPIQFWVSKRRIAQGKKVSRRATATIGGFSSMVALPTIVTFFLAGAWHGAGFKFLAFGLLHAFYIMAAHAWRAFVPEKSLPRRIVSYPVGVVLTYLAVIFALVFFRASSVEDAGIVIGDMAGKHGWGTGWPASQIVLLTALFAVVWLMPNTQEILGEVQHTDQPNWSVLRNLRWQPTVAWLAVTSAAFALCMYYSTASTTFVYFKF